MSNNTNTNTNNTNKNQLYGQCRCCLDFGYHEEITGGVQQSFRDTLSETFSLSLSSDPSLTTMICRLCIYRLNDASEFKSMVAQSERLLLSKVEGTTSKEDVATSVDKSSGVKTEESEQSTQENEQNDNATNNSTCKDDVGEKTDGQNAAKDDQENVDSTSVDSLSLLKRVYNYIPRNRKTCTKCEGKQNNVVKKTNNYNKSVKSLRLKKEYACTSCKYTTNVENAFKYHTKAHSATTQYLCDTCSYISDDKEIFIKHFRLHTEELPLCRKIRTNKSVIYKFMDRNISKNYTSQDNSTNHNTNKTFTGEKPFACGICDRKFINNTNLKVHIRTQHAGERRFACNLCDKRFTRSDSLICHIRTHTGEKPYACTICDQRFGNRGSLIEHKRKHTGKKANVCKLCNKNFAQKRNLEVHMRTHTGEKRYACEICQTRFTNNSNLKVHIRTQHHAAEKRFACHFCDMKFSRNDTLINHIRTHTGEKPYPCKICGEKFGSRGSLFAHNKKHNA